jgi:dnd system-associated protein 4
MRMITNSVHRSRAYENTLQLLGGPGSKMFTTLRDALSFAAALGYREGRRWKLDEKLGREDIQATVYNGNDAIDLIFAIALAETKSAEILKPSNERECIQIFEEYANGGLSLITEWIEKYPHVDLEMAIWRGLKIINFIPNASAPSDDNAKLIDF